MAGVSIKQVAEAAKVSVSAASKALNDYPDVSGETRKRVQDIAKQMGYVPNQLAKKLASKNKKNMAILLSNSADKLQIDSISYALMFGANQYVAEKGMSVATYIVNPNLHEEKALMAFCQEYSLSGVLIFGLSMDDPYVSEADKATIPCVVVDVPLKGPYTASVRINDTKAFEEITDFVIKKNHKKIVLVYGRKASSVSVERYHGFCNALRKHGLPIKDIPVIYGDFSEEIAKSETEKFLKVKGNQDDAVFVCMSDMMALGVCQAIRESGYQIPKDFSVTGFDNLQFLEYVEPRLATVDQKFVDKGYEAARLLKRMVDGKTYKHEVVLPYSLIEGSSVKQL